MHSFQGMLNLFFFFFRWTIKQARIALFSSQQSQNPLPNEHRFVYVPVYCSMSDVYINSTNNKDKTHIMMRFVFSKRQLKDVQERTFGGLNGYVSGIFISSWYRPPWKEKWSRTNCNICVFLINILGSGEWQYLHKEYLEVLLSRPSALWSSHSPNLLWSGSYLSEGQTTETPLVTPQTAKRELYLWRLFLDKHGIFKNKRLVPGCSTGTLARG